MTYFESLPADDGVRHAMALNKRAGRALVALHTAITRDDSALSAGERELIAAFVSSLNGCTYCCGVHAVTAEAFGIDAELLGRMLADIASSGVQPRFVPLPAYVRKLTLAPSRIVAADAGAVIAAGWTERALHDAISVARLFTFTNRFADGRGIQGNEALFAERGQALKSSGYDPLLSLLAD